MKNVTATRMANASALCALGLSALLGWSQVAAAAPGAKTSGATKSGQRAGKDARKSGGMGQLRRLSTTLGLSEAQKARLKPILQSAGQRTKAVRASTTLTPEQKKAKLREIRATTQSAMEPILTAEQKRKLKQMRQETKKRQAARRSQKRAA